jgi:GNAT superfamily N-acetyltransferase
VKYILVQWGASAQAAKASANTRREQMAIYYTNTIDGVDWAMVKRVLQEDDFDNGRTPEQYELSARNSAINIFAWSGDENSREGELVGTVRVLSDGVCNAYMVDVWTHSAWRKQGIARAMIEQAIQRLPGQHLYLFTDDSPEFYARLGFKPRGVGLEYPVGDWLVNHW